MPRARPTVEGCAGPLRIAWSNFVRAFGPINTTVVSTTEDPETGEVRETHRRPNLQPFLDDPDCWLVASIEDYDLESDTARPGPIFTERVIAPPAPPIITSAADALAVVLNERGHVDPDHIAELLHRDADDVIAELGSAIFRDPADGSWQTADAYLSGPVRRSSRRQRPRRRSIPRSSAMSAALREVQPADLRPSDITARLGAPWIPACRYRRLRQGDDGCRDPHPPHAGTRLLDRRGPAARLDGRRHVGMGHRAAARRPTSLRCAQLPQCRRSSTPSRTATASDACSTSSIPRRRRRSCQKIKTAFQNWIWSDPDRTDRLARVYNDRFNNIVPRAFDGSHLKLPGASGAFVLYGHQKRGIWRIIASGATYLAHAVGAGKTMTMAAAIMEQRRLGLIAKAMLVVPGHCLAQAAREFLALYPNARILVADETNFTKDKRHRFLSRAATATWDAIIITHSAFRFIGVPSAFEQQMIQDELELYEQLLDQGRERGPGLAQAARAAEGGPEGTARSARYAQGRSPDHLRDRRRPDHRR